MKLPFAYYGNPILRKKAKRIEAITPEIRQLVNDMIETMATGENAIGLAAPQVHHSLALFVTKVPIQKDEDQCEPGILRVFINPKILEYGEEKSTSQEGCLSIPKVYGNVTRPDRIKVEATDLEGKQFVGEFSGLEARCIMHENDHINGVLFIDRVHGQERKELQPKLRQVKKTYLA